MEVYQAVIVGGGPAGLEAALLMARGRTQALVYDAGKPRHVAGARVRSFLGADGMAPDELRRRAREQLEPYGTIDFREAEVRAIKKLPEGGFLVSAEGQPDVETCFVLLALGMIDDHLDIPGYRIFWGRSVFHCPHCHLWEFRDQPIGVLVRHPDMLEVAPRLLSWSRDITIFAGPQVQVPPEFVEKAEALNIRIETRRVQSLRGAADTGMMSAVELQGGTRIRCAALLYRPEQRQCELVQSLGLKLTEDGFVEVDELQQTSIPGIYAAGDLTTGYQQVAEAVALGHRAAFSIELELKDIEVACAFTP